MNKWIVQFAILAAAITICPRSSTAQTDPACCDGKFYNCGAYDCQPVGDKCWKAVEVMPGITAGLSSGDLADYVRPLEWCGQTSWGSLVGGQCIFDCHMPGGSVGVRAGQDCAP